MNRENEMDHTCGWMDGYVIQIVFNENAKVGKVYIYSSIHKICLKTFRYSGRLCEEASQCSIRPRRYHGAMVGAVFIVHWRIWTCHSQEIGIY
jgi:hypothetical protein